ncbi:MAG: SAM-dependent methyltransferase [Microcoleaceae cyanobacterium]
MGLQLESVIPWGRNLEEYTRMFDLTTADFNGSILDCAAGPASFNAEMTHQGYSVVSSDPIYQFSVAEIEQRIQATYDIVISGVRKNLQSYVWQQTQSPEQLGQVRMAAMRKFLQDFSQGLVEQRYSVTALPQLPFAPQQFDLALCGHFLFTYSEHLSEVFHVQSVLELCRVAREVRIFPTLTLSGQPSPFLAIVMQELIAQGYTPELKTVPYEFQKGGNQMLSINC